MCLFKRDGEIGSLQAVLGTILGQLSLLVDLHPS
jgi:hypothetical protein